jgi:[acyl-carrier-protein] S-malonyltransferase
MKERQVAAVFPGQGSQRPGMGKDFYDRVVASRDTYAEASDALGWDIGELCFGEDARLDLTEYTQPCILTTEIAMLRGLESLFGFDPDIFGGHSLGEFTALVAAGALPFTDALKIVHLRGKLMQDAAPVGIGGMSAVISDRLDAGAIQKALDDLPVDVANVNSIQQVVISGSADSMSAAALRVMGTMPDDQNFHFVPLNVSAPFHSRFMRRIERPFEDALQEMASALDMRRTTRVTSNYTGGFHSDLVDEVIRDLVFQISNPVQWRSNMAALSKHSAAIYEIGPGRPLREFFKTMQVDCLSVTTLSAAMRIFAGFN